MLSFTQNSLPEADDKYAKAGAQTTCMSKFMTMTTLQVYLCFLMATSTVYYMLGGNIRTTTVEDKLSYASCIAEGFGLLALRIKIARQGSVSGISGMTMVMYAVVYFLRLLEVVPDKLSLLFLDGWIIEVLQIGALYMVCDVVRSVFVTYRNSYQADLDVFHVKYLIPVCVALATVVHPIFSQGAWFSFCWTAYLYLDCLALLPQVVMMARGGGKVEAPIAHFVAATALSRGMDLSFWYFDFDLGAQGFYGGFNFSGWLIVFWHVLNLAIVADFMYYYVKARFSGKAMSAPLALPLFEV